MRRRTLSDAERELWTRATRDVVRPRRPLISEPRERARPAPSIPPPRAKGPDAASNTVRANLTRSAVFGGGDPKADRRAAKRRIATARTLDLHGLTQASAERLLLREIPAAHQEGARLVLVVTGKGRTASTEGRTGVLRARFLEWIERPPLRALIARVAPARPKDGGAGAFYVFLKGKSGEARGGRKS